MNLDLHKSNSSLLFLLSLFCCALVVHLGSSSWIKSLSYFTILAAGVLQVINYKFWWASLLAILLFLKVTLPVFPNLANHCNLEIFIGLFIVLVVARKVILNKGVDSHTVTLCFRYFLVTTYFLAGFHKLNSGFFNLTNSCSIFVDSHLTHLLMGKSYIPSPAVIRLHQTATIFLEMVVPFGILFNRTRRIAIIVLAAFHFYLSICNFYNFSAFAGFLIAGCVVDLRGGISAELKRGLRFYQITSILSVITILLLDRYTAYSKNLMMFYCGIVYNIGWVILVRAILLQRYEERKLRPSYLPYITSGLVAAWGLQCYVGLSNTATLTMFSNLITEKSRGNHYIINTNKTKIWSFEEDYVTIMKLPSSEISKDYMYINYDLPLIEFKKLANEWSGKGADSCVIKYKNKIVYINNLRQSDFSKTKWWYRFLLFRRIPQKGANECMW